MTDSQILKNIRKALRLHQDELANALGMKQGSISDIERGKNGLSRSLKKSLSDKFYIAKLYFEGEEVQMFMPGKEDVAMLEADKYRKKNRKKSGFEDSELSQPSTEIEKLRRELDHRAEILAAKEETVSVLKQQVTEYGQQLEHYRKLLSTLQREKIELQAELEVLRGKSQGAKAKGSG
ncbi:MAG: helix-turn-helix transcriptional regulator [Pseudosphingobacterium sp.]|nr:helix-turn-helix transcriptional regulator [Pseudosphingobacterium sp.]